MSQKTYKNIILDRSLPEFVKDDYPMVEEFLGAYYDWLETSKNTIDITKNLKEYRSIDTTLPEFEEYFFKEYLANIPSNILADRSLLLKYIRSFYQQKGNEASFKLLFRILYNEKIEFYYPKKDILRASDGKWYIQRILKIPFQTGMDISEIVDKRIVGNTSGASAVVQSAIRYTERGQDIIELSIENIYGQFADAETIKIYYSDLYYTSQLFKLYTSVEITNGGSQYKVGDVFSLKDGSTTVGIGRVKKTTRGDVNGFDVNNGGVGYNGDIKKINRFYGLPINSTLDGNYLPTTPLHSPSISYDTTPINFTITPIYQNTGNPDEVIIEDSSNSFGYGATAIVHMVDQDGSILEITLISSGDGYELPIAFVESSTGTGADISVTGGGGLITKVSLDSFPIQLSTDTPSSIETSFIGSGDGDAEGNVLSSSFAQSEGRYLNTDGHLSSNKKLQDNYYYQDYSYVLKTKTVIENWRNSVIDLIHPAGTLMFGDVYIVSNLDSLNSSINTNDVDISDTDQITAITLTVSTLSATITTF